MASRFTTPIPIIISSLPLPPVRGTINATLVNTTRVYSPVMLSNEWSKLERLIFLVFCSCLGTTMNGFFVAAFFVEHTLKKAGNVFLACTGMADLIVTTAVMPASVVVLLSGEWDTIQVCRALHFLASSSTYSYSLFFMMVSIETYYRLCHTSPRYKIFSPMRVGIIAVVIFTVSFIMAAVGVFLNFDYDYCQRNHNGDSTYKIATSIIFYAAPFVLTVVGLVYALIRIRRRAREQTQYKRSQQYERDSSTTSLNITAFLFYAFSWLPYVIVIVMYPNTNDTKFYHCVWIGICRSVFTSLLYSVAGRSFRRAFAYLFNYCCCKSTLSGSFTNRHRRALDYRPASEVRVHIMHHAVNAGTPHQRAAAASRETMEI